MRCLGSESAIRQLGALPSCNVARLQGRPGRRRKRKKIPLSCPQAAVITWPTRKCEVSPDSEDPSHFHSRPGRAESLLIVPVTPGDGDGTNCPTARARGLRNTASSAALPGRHHGRPGLTGTAGLRLGLGGVTSRADRRCARSQADPLARAVNSPAHWQGARSESDRDSGADRAGAGGVAAPTRPAAAALGHPQSKPDSASLTSRGVGRLEPSSIYK